MVWISLCKLKTPLCRIDFIIVLNKVIVEFFLQLRSFSLDGQSHYCPTAYQEFHDKWHYVVSKLLVVFFESGTIHVNGTVHAYCTIHQGIVHAYGTVQVGNSGVSGVIVWFCTCVGKFCHKGDNDLRSLDIK